MAYQKFCAQHLAEWRLHSPGMERVDCALSAPEEAAEEATAMARISTTPTGITRIVPILLRGAILLHVERAEGILPIISVINNVKCEDMRTTCCVDSC